MFVCVALLMLAATAHAQRAVRSLEFHDFGFTRPLSPGARPAGLAGAYVSAANDVHALVYNPAGLARIKRFEASIGLLQEQNTMESNFYGTPSSIETRDGAMELLSAAFPVPTYRGAFTGAVGAYRMFSSYLDLHYTGFDPNTGERDDYLLQQTGALTSYNIGLGVDLASVLSGGISFFLVDGSIESLRQWGRNFTNEVPSRQRFLADEVKMDVDGVGAKLGGQFFILPGLQAGLVFTTPVMLSARGTGLTETSEHIDNGIDSFFQSFGSVTADYVLPFRVDVGLSGEWYGLLAEVDVTWTDWTEASIDGRRLRNQSLQTMFREVFDVRVGAEWTLPWIPARIRGGYARIPNPLLYMQSDRVDIEDLERAEIITERQQWSVGAGGLVGKVLTLEAAFTHTEGERATPSISHRRESQSFVLTAAYRF
jgi:long-subunit fatty acid transport protein